MLNSTLCVLAQAESLCFDVVPKWEMAAAFYLVCLCFPNMKQHSRVTSLLTQHQATALVAVPSVIARRTLATTLLVDCTY